MNNILSFRLILFILGLSFFLSCKSKKLVTPSTNTVTVGWEQVLDAHNVDFEWLGAKANVRFEDDVQSFSGKLYLRMKKSESIWMVGKKLSIEGARILITPDSVFVINRLERNYMAGSFSAITKQYGISLNFDELQNLLAGNILYSNQDSVLNTSSEEDMQFVTTSFRDFLTKYEINSSTGTLRSFKTSDQSNRVVFVSLSDYQFVENEQKTPF